MKAGVYQQPDAKLIEIIPVGEDIVWYLWDTNPLNNNAYGPYVRLIYDGNDKWFHDIKNLLKYLGPL